MSNLILLQVVAEEVMKIDDDDENLRCLNGGERKIEEDLEPTRSLRSDRQRSLELRKKMLDGEEVLQIP